MIHCLIPDLPRADELAPWLARIDQNRWYTNSGPLLRDFERQLSTLIDAESQASCVALASGTAALELGLQALGVSNGKRVLLPALTFPASALAVLRCGGEPVLADVCPATWMLTPAIAREVLARESIDLVMPVAAFGMPLPSAQWDRFAAETQVSVVADAAGALGVQPAGRHVHWAFSLHATKPMGIGEGGLFASFDNELVSRVRRLANFGFDHAIVPIAGGTNAKLSEYAAAVGLAQLQRWSQVYARRRAIYLDYGCRLAELPDVRMQGDAQVAPATLCVQLPVDPGAMATRLAAAGIETRRWYLPPLYEHPAFNHLRRVGLGGDSELPTTKRLAATLLGLPFHTRLSSSDIARIVSELAAGIAAAAGNARLG